MELLGDPFQGQVTNSILDRWRSSSIDKYMGYILPLWSQPSAIVETDWKETK